MRDGYCKRLPNTATAEELVREHREKMMMKARRIGQPTRATEWLVKHPSHFVSSRHNRHTGEPHEHKREIARRLRQEAKRAA